ncbi:cell wall protein Ecm33 [Exophiala xenobiotica]|uniref:Cell wall protein Ecm33 n=1 Tax=Lithohypha guttulata TaxID=1690604 RepID=A0ABR0KGG5_9EURO|nr:cell wall protein Ecm33 [Lithohypha guttulata]KAK5321552.1 cell wall protein Ecm33 [Exophiala xenobiotica]
MAARFFLPALALVGSALAQCDGPEITINSSEDASQISSCETYDGDVIISSEASGQLSLDGVERISGDLRCTNASQLTAISADKLSQIGGIFDLEELQIMSSLQMSALVGVNQIKWIALPALQSLNFAQGVAKANQVYISNTGLTDLAGIELEQVASMDINNNQYLKTINVNGLTNVTQSLSFSANGMNLEIEFPNLVNAANLTFRNVSSISMPSLSEVPGSMGFYSNAFESFAAPNLTSTGNTIAFVDSPSLTNISFPMLETIGGGVIIANNTELTSLTGAFDSLETIDGDINFYGTFEAVSFKALTDVKGASTIYTSSSNTSICDLFNSAKKNQVIKGKVTCVTESDNTAGNGSSSSSGSSGSNKQSAAVSNFAYSAPLAGIAAFIAAVLFI